MISFLLAAAAAAMPAAPTPLAPLGSLITASDYPAGAMRQGITGHVGFRLRIDASGKPDGCVVSQTSGSAELDNATCDLMLARARFTPAMGSDGTPERGDYQARIAWAITTEPEAVKSGVIRVRTELDAGGKAISCTFSPPSAGTELGGCKLFGDPRMLVHLVGRPLPGLASVEMRVIKQVSTDPPLADPVPKGAIKNVLGRSTVTIAPDGTIGGCTNEVVTHIEGRLLDLCAIDRGDPDAKFTPSATSQPRQFSIIMEMVSQPR